MEAAHDIEPADVAKYWWLTLSGGILLVVLGALMFLQSEDALTFMIWLLGIVWLGSGALAIIQTFMLRRRERRQHRRRERHLMGFIVGGISIALGLVAFSHNLGNVVLDTGQMEILLGGAALFVGIVQILQGRGGTRQDLILGILNVSVGAGLLFLRDALGNVLVFLIGAAVSAGGGVLIWYSFWLRRQGETAPEPVPEQ